MEVGGQKPERDGHWRRGPAHALGWVGLGRVHRIRGSTEYEVARIRDRDISRIFRDLQDPSSGHDGTRTRDLHHVKVAL